MAIDLGNHDVYSHVVIRGDTIGVAVLTRFGWQWVLTGRMTEQADGQLCVTIRHEQSGRIVTKCISRAQLDAGLKAARRLPPAQITRSV